MKLNTTFKISLILAIASFMVFGASGIFLVLFYFAIETILKQAYKMLVVFNLRLKYYNLNDLFSQTSLLQTA